MSGLPIQIATALALAGALYRPSFESALILGIFVAYLAIELIAEKFARPVRTDNSNDVLALRGEIQSLAGDNAKIRIDLERLRDENAKVHALAEDAKKLMSTANLGMGFKPRAARE